MLNVELLKQASRRFSNMAYSAASMRRYATTYSASDKLYDKQDLYERLSRRAARRAGICPLQYAHKYYNNHYKDHSDCPVHGTHEQCVHNHCNVRCAGYY